MILNVGCGHKPCRNGVNVDLHPEDRHQCNVAWTPQNLELFAKADGHALPFPDGSFDAVYCSHTLEHCESPLRVLREFNRVIRDGGHVLLKVPSQFYWSYSWNHIYSWNPDTIRELCEKVFPKVWVGYTSRMYARVGKYGILIDLLSRLLMFKTELIVLCTKEK